jgi:hypothetical protein
MRGPRLGRDGRLKAITLAGRSTAADAGSPTPESALTGLAATAKTGPESSG